MLRLALWLRFSTPGSALPRPIEFLLETTRGCTVRLRRVNFP